MPYLNDWDVPAACLLKCGMNAEMPMPGPAGTPGTTYRTSGMTGYRSTAPMIASTATPRTTPAAMFTTVRISTAATSYLPATYPATVCDVFKTWLVTVACAHRSAMIKPPTTNVRNANALPITSLLSLLPVSRSRWLSAPAHPTLPATS